MPGTGGRGRHSRCCGTSWAPLRSTHGRCRAIFLMDANETLRGNARRTKPAMDALFVLGGHGERD